MISLNVKYRTEVIEVRFYLFDILAFFDSLSRRLESKFSLADFRTRITVDISFKARCFIIEIVGVEYRRVCFFGIALRIQLI